MPSIATRSTPIVKIAYPDGSTSALYASTSSKGYVFRAAHVSRSDGFERGRSSAKTRDAAIRIVDDLDHSVNEGHAALVSIDDAALAALRAA